MDSSSSILGIFFVTPHTVSPAFSRIQCDSTIVPGRPVLDAQSIDADISNRKKFLTLLFVLRWHTAALPRPRSCSFSIFFFRFRGGRGSSTAMRGVLILRVKTLASYVARPLILRGSSPTRVYRLSRNAVKPPREREKRGLAKHAPEQRKRHRAPRPPQLLFLELG